MARPQLVLIPAEPLNFFSQVPRGFGASLAQRGHELLPVVVVPEDILALVPTVHDVIHGPGILNAQLARHGQPLPTRPGGFDSEDCHLYGTVFKGNTDSTGLKVLENFDGSNNEAYPETRFLLSGKTL